MASHARRLASFPVDPRGVLSFQRMQGVLALITLISQHGQLLLRWQDSD